MCVTHLGSVVTRKQCKRFPAGLMAVYPLHCAVKSRTSAVQCCREPLDPPMHPLLPSTHLPMLAARAERADGHATGPALFGGRAATHPTQHHQLSQRVHPAAVPAQFIHQRLLTAGGLSRQTRVGGWRGEWKGGLNEWILRNVPTNRLKGMTEGNQGGERAAAGAHTVTVSILHVVSSCPPWLSLQPGA
jgi:hypothetical protein